MNIEIKDIQKRFGDFVALHRINLAIRQGELLALLGPSGSGKTTLLRIIAGLEQPTSGAILFGGDDLVGQSLRERKIGFVFQHYALFRHMTVFENVAFGLRVKRRRERPGEAEIGKRVRRLLDLVQLGPFGGRYPSQLSGGQRQRVALARALAIGPRVLMLDEPFGALDAKVRKELRRWLRGLHDEMGLTSVFVTHDQEEALELADRVVIMNGGRIEQIGSPESVYEQPASAFAYEFLGNVNRFECTISNGEAVFPGGTISVSEDVVHNGGEAIAYVRPHDIEVFSGPAIAALPATVRYISAAGPLAKVEVAAADDRLIEIELARPVLRALALKVGSLVHIRARKARVFRRDTEPSPGEALSMRGEGRYPEQATPPAPMWHI
ncbi:MAG: sulfate ABC transporter ATP-binding protein [Defluviicoccus sp.]|nr:sulfate ABC transporter ATP-binding protein [Defluviicoccus sp.]MDG4593718.1 sulfate ABC transporter ATP-binding protein [Defluviicoccus sp.]MDS4072188.1 sulfate ABC transporter ATP-binding protein [Defluviicoccus sp.]